MIKQCPAPRAIDSTREINFEAVVSVSAGDAAAAGAKQCVQLSRPLGMSGSAKAESVRKESRPVIARRILGVVGEAFAPEILLSLLTMGIVCVAEEPCRKRLVMVGFCFEACSSLILLRSCGGEPIKRGHGKFARIPRMISRKLWSSDGSSEVE